MRGFVTHLNYSNPTLSPFDEFQRFKHHPVVAEQLEGGKRIAYGARAISEGGGSPFRSSPSRRRADRLFGRLHQRAAHHKARIMRCCRACSPPRRSRRRAAANRANDEIVEIETEWRKGDIGKDLKRSATSKPLLSRWGAALGTMLGGRNVDERIVRLLLLRHDEARQAGLCDAEAAVSQVTPIVYPKPDGKLSFDKLSSVFLSSTNHEEDQPIHLRLKDPSIPVGKNLPEYGEPAPLLPGRRVRNRLRRRRATGRTRAS